MDVNATIEFLKEHQPMPDDQALSDNLIQQYNQAREALLQFYDERVVPLVLGSFGSGTGFGVYQLMDEVLRKYPAEVVIPALIDALKMESPGRWWCLQMALDFPDRALAESCKQLLKSSNRDERFFAAANLEQIYRPSDKVVVDEMLRVEKDEEIREILERMIS